MPRAERVPGIDPDSGVRANAALIVPVRISELLAWERFIYDPERVGELHRMRIAAKRLRYTMEIFGPSYGSDFGAAIDKVKWVQEQLGDIHDADVLVPELQRAAVECLGTGRGDAAPGVHRGDLDGAAGLIALCRRKRDERDATYRRFVDGWQKLRASLFFESLRAIVWDITEPLGSRRGEAESTTCGPAPAVAAVGKEEPHGEGGGSRNGSGGSDPTAEPGGGHTGGRSDPGPLPEEGRLG